MNGKVRQHTTIDLDIKLLETIDQSRIRQAVLSCTRIDALDPKTAEHALLHFAVTVGVLACFGDSLLG